MVELQRVSTRSKRHHGRSGGQMPLLPYLSGVFPGPTRGMFRLRIIPLILPQFQVFLEGIALLLRQLRYIQVHG